MGLREVIAGFGIDYVHGCIISGELCMAYNYSNIRQLKKNEPKYASYTSRTYKLSIPISYQFQSNYSHIYREKC